MNLDLMKPIFRGLRTTKEQTSLHTCAVCSAIFFIRLLECITSRLASSKISVFSLVSVAEETGLSLNFSEKKTEDRFSCIMAHMKGALNSKFNPKA